MYIRRSTRRKLFINLFVEKNPAMALGTGWKDTDLLPTVLCKPIGRTTKSLQKLYSSIVDQFNVHSFERGQLDFNNIGLAFPSPLG